MRQGSPRQNLESDDVYFDYSFDRVPFSPLSVDPNRFSFSVDMDKAPDLAERALKSPAKASKNPKKSAESSKINKKPLIIKHFNFIQSEKQMQNLFCEINLNIKILKNHFLFMRKY